jgi:hypothetical protein
LIGQFVTGLPGEGGAVDSGVVIGIRFAEGGRPILQLASGVEMPLEQVAVIQSPQSAAQALVGKMVLGVDRRQADQPELVEGMVTASTTNDTGEVVLELDTGESLRLADVLGVSSSQAAT